MTKKYHVFISSTLEDLRQERRELEKIIIELGALPVTTDALDESGGDFRGFVKKAVEESDYFLSLTAHRIGAGDGKVSYLEREYHYAVKYGVPVIALIIDEKARWKASKKETGETALRALENFKKKLSRHSHDTWTTLGELRQKALTLLLREMTLNPRPGWVRAGEAVKPSVANELSRLIQENEDLKARLRAGDGDLVDHVRGQMKHALKILAVNKISLSFYYVPGENWENTRTFRYLRIFKLLVPELTLSKTTAELSHFLGNILNPDLEKTVRKDYPVPSNTIKKIMADLCLLKLVRSASGASGREEEDEAWELTEYGKEVYAAYRMRQMERGLKKAEEAHMEIQPIGIG
jgi:hypothetical protein